MTAVRDIIHYAAQREVLRRRSRPVRVIDRRARKVIRDLKDTLVDHREGIGLAAPQIGVRQRIVVVRLGSDGGAGTDLKPPIALVNPTILQSADERMDFDGCLSFPRLYAETVRPHYLEVKGLDESSRAVRWIFKGFDAVLAHHEIDHLDGVLFIDRVDRLEDFYTIDLDLNGYPHRKPVAVRRRGREIEIPATWQRRTSPRLL